MRSWLPGKNIELARTFALPKDLLPGQYVLAVSILDPSGMVPAARFAVNNYWSGGRTPVGPVSVGVAAPKVQLNEFDDLQEDSAFVLHASFRAKVVLKL